MRCRMGYGRGAMVVIALAAPLAVWAAEMRTEAWRDDFEVAESEAKQRGLPMLLHFHADWCVCCQEMEHTVLRDPVLLKQLRSGFVAVKINSDYRPDLRKRFHIEKLPTDVFLDPRGYVVQRTSGVHDRDSYLAMVARIAAAVTRSQAMHIASHTKPPLESPRVFESPRAGETPLPLGAAPPPIAPDPVRSNGVEPVPIAAIPAEPYRQSRPRETSRRWVSLGMRGFSPVALATRREWVPGDQQFSAEYKGIVYFLSSNTEQRRFQESPDRYAPQILGCDPVILDIADRAVPGDIRYAAFFDGELYLFVSDKSRQLFKHDPRRFVRAKHVLKVDELDEKCLE